MLQISHAVVSFARQMFQNRVVVVTSGSMAGFPKTLLPSELDRVAQAVSDIRMGIPVALSNGTERIVFLSAESVGDEQVAAIRSLGQVELAISDWRALTLKLAACDGDLARIAVPEGASGAWVCAVANPADDLANPMMGPFSVFRGGSAELSRMALRLCKQAHLLPAALSVRTEGLLPASVREIRMAEAESYFAVGMEFSEVVSARVPLALARAGKVRVFRGMAGGDEHYAVEIGDPDRNSPVLARLHSACFTGDILGSLKCDCGPQLRTALAAMGAEGVGVLLYLNQEGRGIGLANKMRAYALQDQGFDTVEANHRLGFEDDERDFRIGARLLRNLGFSSVRLMTNNPAKVRMMEDCGIEVVQRVPLKVGETPDNSSYLDTKARKSGHLL